MNNGNTNRASHLPVAPQPSISLSELIEKTWRKKWYLACCTAVAVALGYAFLQRTQSIYQVRARLLVVQEGGMAGERAGAGRHDKDFLATQAEIIRSPAVVANAVESVDQPNAATLETDPVLATIANLKVSPLAGTNVLSIAFRSEDAEHAASTVDAIINSYQEYRRDLERDSHFDELQALTQSEKDLRADLESLQTEYGEMREGSPLMGQGKDPSGVQRAMLTKLGESLIETKQRRMEMENHHRQLVGGSKLVTPADKGQVFVASQQLSEQPETPKTESVNLNRFDAQVSLLAHIPKEAWLAFGDPEVLQQEIRQAQVREQELDTRYGDKHPEMKAVREQIDALQNLLQNAIDAGPQIMQQEIASIRKQEDQLSGLYETEFTKAKQLDDYVLKEQQKLESIQRAQTMHDTILVQLRELKLAETALNAGRSAVNVRILESPTLPASKVWPPGPLLLVVCGVIGLLVGCGLIAVTEFDLFGNKSDPLEREIWTRSTDRQVAPQEAVT